MSTYEKFKETTFRRDQAGLIVADCFAEGNIAEAQYWAEKYVALKAEAAELGAEIEREGAR